MDQAACRTKSEMRGLMAKLEKCYYADGCSVTLRTICVLYDSVSRPVLRTQVLRDPRPNASRGLA